MPDIPCLDPDRPLNAEELAEERWERRRARVRNRAHIERLETALRWALEQIEETPGNRSALADAWELLED
jgi:hypothetical protein